MTGTDRLARPEGEVPPSPDSYGAVVRALEEDAGRHAIARLRGVSNGEGSVALGRNNDAVVSCVAQRSSATSTL